MNQAGRGGGQPSARLLRASIVVASLPVLVGLGCSGQTRSGATGGGPSLGGASGAGGRGGAGGVEPVAMGVLRANVRVLDPSQVKIGATTPDTWVVDGAFTAQPGDVVLMDTIAAKVVTVSTAPSATTLSVTQAGVADVFSKLDVDQNIDLTNAQFTPGSDAAGSNASAPFARRPSDLLTRANGDATTIGITLNNELNVPINLPPVTGSLTMGLTGTISAGYDDVHGASGAVAATGYFHGSATAALMETVTISPETTIGTIRIPIPVSVFDAALKYLGVRLAAIYVPVSVGIETTTGYGISITADGSASTTLTASYDDTNGFATMPPTVTGSASVTGSLPGAGPAAIVQDSLSFGVYVRAKPQLLILNEVASIGGNIKVGRYVKGTLSGYLQPPSYCLNVQGEIDAEVSAFFKGTGIPEKDSPSWSPPGMAVGAPFTAGSCSMGGAGGAGGANPGGGASGGGASGGLGGAAGGAAGNGAGGGAGNEGSSVPSRWTISAGFQDTCVVLTDGTVYCWGGYYPSVTQTLPDGRIAYEGTTIPDIDDAVSVSLNAENQGCVIRENGTVWCWSSATQPIAPSPVEGITGATSVTMAGFGACAVADGGVYCWGCDGEGAPWSFGVQSSSTSCTPAAFGPTSVTQATTISDAIQVVLWSGETGSGMALLDDGSLVEWDGTVPKKIDAPGQVAEIGLPTGYYYPNPNYLLTDGSIYSGNSKSVVAGIARGVRLSGSSAVMTDGTVLRGGAFSQKIGGISSAVAISEGNDHACAILADHTVQCFSLNGTTATPVYGISTAAY